MRKHSRSIWSSPILSIFLSVTISFTVTLICITAFSAIIRFLLKDMGLADIFASISLIAGIFTGSYLCGHYRRRHGIIIGAACGIVVFIILYAAGLALSESTAGIRKLLLLTVSGMTGGVYGTNSKHPHLKKRKDQS